MNKGTFRCVFGDHKYSEEKTKDKQGFTVRMCKHCNLHGYCINYLDEKVYIEYYPNGYRKREVYSYGGLKKALYKCGRVYDYNKRGVCVYSNHTNGTEEWLHRGRWYSYRPKKWNPENEKPKKWNTENG